MGIRKELFCVALKILESIDEFVRTEYVSVYIGFPFFCSF
jgi:hypothetical protein